jgi:hypothetical protein
MYTPTSFIAKVLTFLLTLNIIVAGASLYVLHQWHQIANTTELNYDSASLMFQSNFLDVATSIVFISCAIGFLVWFSKVYENHRYLAGEAQYRKSWAFWSFIIPFISLYRPYDMAAEVYRGASENVESPKWYGLLLVWWISFLAMLIMRRLANSESGSTVLDWAPLGAAATIIAAIACIAWVNIVVKKQDATYAHRMTVQTEAFVEA